MTKGLELKKMVDDLFLKELNYYTGSECYHNVLNTNVTDGVAYVMKNGYSWFVTDALAVIKCDEKVKTEEFLAIKLKLLGETQAVMEISDGNNKVLYLQNYNYTTAKKELTLYFTNKVLLLSGEY